MKKVKRIILVALLLLFTIPIIATTLFAVPSADDFSHIVNYKSCNGNVLIFPWYTMYKTYMTWQGSYLSNLLAGIPTFYFGGVALLRAELVLVALLLFLVMYLTIWVVVRSLSEESNNTNIVIVLACGLFFLVFYKMELQEVLLWRTVSITYTFPLILTLASIVVWCLARGKSTRKRLIFVGILAFLAAGGVLQISGLLCSLTFMLIVVEVINKHIHKETIILFFTSLIGSLINVIAPGNYVRRSTISDDFNVLSNLKKTIIFTNQSMFRDGLIYPFILVLAIVFVISFSHSKDWTDNKATILFIAIYAFLGPIITNFPVVLGYNGNGFPGRCKFILNVSLVLYGFIFAYALGYYSKWIAKIEFSKSSLIIILVSAMMINTSVLSIDYWYGMVPIKVAHHILNGDYNQTAIREMNYIRTLKESEESEIVFVQSYPPEGYWCDIKTIGLEEDPDNWVNKAIANLYGKKSVRIEYQ